MNGRLKRSRQLLHNVSRSVALSLGGFALISLSLACLTRRFDGNLLWIDLRAMPVLMATPMLAAACGCMMAFALRPAMGTQRRRVTLALVGVLIVVAGVNAMTCIVLDARGSVQLAGFLPFSVLVALMLGLVFTGIAMADRVDVSADAGCDTRRTIRDWVRQGFANWRHLATQVIVLLAFIVGIPLSQMLWFGQSDYRRAADAVVVFGARAYADGTMSDALEDRVRTACELYENGFVQQLIFSGGPGDGDIHEAQAMQRFAVARGIDIEDTVLDFKGINTRATVENTVPMFQAAGVRRVLVVSHDYHLPRIKMAYQQQGIEAYTVPAKQRYRLRAEPIYMTREVVAWWWYYLHPILG